MNPTVNPTSTTSVLLIDDDPDIRDALSDMLKHEGYLIHAVGTGREGIDRVQSTHYGAVLLDIGLPDMDGHSVLKALSEADAELPVIILTGHVTEYNTVGPLTKGAFAYVIKPYNPRAIKAILRRACDVRALSVKAQTAEHALTESEERFRSVVQSTSDGVILADEEGRIVFWNKSAERMFFYKEEEILGRSVTAIMPAGFHDVHRWGLERARSGYARLLTSPLEVYGLRKDGTSFPLELSLATWKSDEHMFFGGIIRDITERKRVETALRRSEEQFRQLAENIKEVFWLTDVDQEEILYISPAYEEIWGQSCESLYARPASWIDAIHPEDREQVRVAASKQVQGDYHEEYRIIRPDGTIRWIRDRAFPICDETGAVYRIAGIAECITAQKIAEQRKAAQYAVTRVLAEASSLNEASPRILEAIGEGLGWDVAAIWSVDDAANVLRCVDLWHSDVVDAGAFDLSSREMTFPCGAGLPGRVWASGEPSWIPDVTQDDNFPRGPAAALVGLHTAVAFPIKLNTRVLGVFEFLTGDVRLPDDDLLAMMSAIGSQIGQFAERKHAQAALVQAYDKMDAVLGSLPCMILIVDQDQRILYANPQATERFRPEQGTLTGSRLQDMVPLNGSEWPFLLADLESTAAGGKLGVERDVEVRKRVYRYRFFPVTLRGEERRQGGLVMWDITEQKQLQDQLIQAEKLASLGTLVSGMAHEINNPVQGILGMAEIILQEPDPEKVREYARDIVEYSQHVGLVVRNFACYARPASRDGELDVDVAERLAEALKLVQHCPHFGHVDVDLAFDPVPKFRARRTEIDQVFVNLISNAVDAMGGDGRLTLRTGVRDDMIAVTISDTGCGIPKHLLGKIFDPFVTTKDPGKGTGLGLSIVYKIVARYGGRIAVESEEGRGASFTVQFPWQ